MFKKIFIAHSRKQWLNKKHTPQVKFLSFRSLVFLPCLVNCYVSGRRIWIKEKKQWFSMSMIKEGQAGTVESRIFPGSFCWLCKNKYLRCFSQQPCTWYVIDHDLSRKPDQYAIYSRICLTSCILHNLRLQYLRFP